MYIKLLTAGVVISLALSATAFWMAMPIRSKECLREKVVAAFQDDPLPIFTVAMQGGEIHRQQEEARTMKEQQDKVEKLWDRLTSSALPFAGSATGDITIVEFFDYHCGYCRKAHEVIQQLLQDNPSLKVIYHPVPLFTPPLLIQGALAAKKQNKFTEFHHQLFTEQCDGTPEGLAKIAEACGLDVAQFQTDLESDAIKAEMVESQKLYKELAIMGTPAYIINKGEVIPGHLELDEFKVLLKSLKDDKKAA